MDERERHERGMAQRRKVLGNAWVDRANAKKSAFTEEFQDFITRAAWGEVWTRPHYDERTRRVLVIGTMLALDVSLKPDLAFNIILPIFAAAVVGGLGQTYGAIAGGFLVGFAETLAVFDWMVFLRPFRENLPEWLATAQGLSLVPTEYKLTVAFVILVIVLLVKPTGIFKGVST